MALARPSVIRNPLPDKAEVIGCALAKACFIKALAARATRSEAFTSPSTLVAEAYPSHGPKIVHADNCCASIPSAGMLRCAAFEAHLHTYAGYLNRCF
jgi:hypothetical protein